MLWGVGYQARSFWQLMWSVKADAGRWLSYGFDYQFVLVAILALSLPLWRKQDKANGEDVAHSKTNGSIWKIPG